MRAKGRWRAEATLGLSLAAVYLIFSAIFWAYPFLWLAILSLTKWRFFGAPVFIGLGNVIRLLQDSDFWLSLARVLRFFVMFFPIVLLGSLGLALGLRHVGRGRSVIALCFLLANVSSGVAFSLVFAQFFSATGPVNSFLFTHFGTRIPWLLNPTLAMLAIALVVAWKFIGYYGLIIYSGLVMIPKDVAEAAVLDHAGPVTRLLRLVLPMINAQLMMVLIFALITSFSVFTEPYLITGGGPIDATTLPPILIYETAFRRLQPSYAATLSIGVSLAAFILIRIARRLFEREVHLA